MKTNITRALVNWAINLHRSAIRKECYAKDRAADLAHIRVGQQMDVIAAEEAHLEELRHADALAEAAANQAWQGATDEFNKNPYRN